MPEKPKELPKGTGAGEVFPFTPPAPETGEVPDSVVRVGNSLASVEAIVRDRANEWRRFGDSDTGKHGEREKRLTKALIELFEA